jgi:two-component sensor histidine kinase
MLKSLLTCLILVLVGFVGFTQKPQDLLIQIAKSQPDSNRINLLIKLGNYYLGRPSEYKNERRNALGYFDKAITLSKNLHLADKQNEILCLIGKDFFDINDTLHGREKFMQVINYYHKTGNKYREAITWDMLGDCLSVEDKYVPFKIQYYECARDLFKAAHYPLSQMNAIQKIAQNHLNQEKISEAEKELLDVLSQYKALGYKKLHYAYDLLGDVSQSKLDLHEELYYRLLVIKTMEATRDTARAPFFYEKLAITYSDLGEFDKSLMMAMKSLEIMKQTSQLADFYGYLSLVSYDLLSQGKPQEAIAYLRKSSRDVPPFNQAQREDLNECYGNCYVALKQYEKAEPYYLAMMRGFEKTMFNKDYYSDNFEMVTDFVHYNQTMGNFYVLTGQYKKAGAYLNKVLTLPKGVIRPVWLSQMHLNQFRVDSATGNYISAIKHYELHKRINDSLFNAVKSKQISELNISYETNKKEQSIKLLQSQGRTQRDELKRERSITVGGIIMLLIIAGLTYYGYRNKQRSNKQLQNKQKEINAQNIALQKVLTEKDRLLTEKDWLLREVHHRVKNNLQIVMSLLNTQSAYLQNNTAIKAIRESQNRVQAISLIHQKLYSESMASIDTQAYIADLVSYLSDCFDASKRRIRFEQKVQPFVLNLSQAVPLGLMLNEAITNAIKYAFDDNGGQVSIGLQVVMGNNILLTIADDGRGLPHNFDIQSASSLGMEMMKALSKQLDGSFEIENNKGVIISINFQAEKIHHHISTEEFIPN